MAVLQLGELKREVVPFVKPFDPPFDDAVYKAFHLLQKLIVLFFGGLDAGSRVFQKVGCHLEAVFTSVSYG